MDDKEDAVATAKSAPPVSAAVSGAVPLAAEEFAATRKRSVAAEDIRRVVQQARLRCDEIEEEQQEEEEEEEEAYYEQDSDGEGERAPKRRQTRSRPTSPRDSNDGDADDDEDKDGEERKVNSKTATSQPTRPSKPVKKMSTASAADGRSRDDPFIRADVISHGVRTSLGKEYGVYTISVRTSELSWAVTKRYSEFEALHRELLQLDLPEAVAKSAIPKLPPKKLIGNLKDKFLAQRSAALREYVARLMLDPRIYTSVPVLTFLGALSNHEATAAEAPAKTVSRHVYLDEAMQMVEAGDVILFRTNGVLQAMQRTVTSSSYDHVGLVVRVPPGSKRESALYMLESTADGVRKYPLRRRFVQWYLSNAQMVLRRLSLGPDKNDTDDTNNSNNNNTNSNNDASAPASASASAATAENSDLAERRMDVNEDLAEFLHEVDGKDYGLNPVKLLRRQSVGQQQDKDTYFCSELVAAAYKRAKLLPDERSSSGYYPASFAQAANLQLLGGASLGSEYYITFQQPEVWRARRPLYSTYFTDL